MKRQSIISMLAVAAMAMFVVSCSTDDDWTGSNSYEYETADGRYSNPSSGSSSVPATALTNNLSSFDVALDTSVLIETDNIDSEDEDYIENNSFDQTVKIVFSDNNATISGAADGIAVSVAGSDVVVNSTVKNIAYELSGSTTDGSLKIYSEKKFALRLNGVSITNPTGAAINIQSGKRAYVVLVDGTENTLTDGKSYTDVVEGEDMKGTFFSEGELLFSGSGTLSVNANCKAGIASDDYVLFRPGNNVNVKSTSGNGVKANDAVLVRGGVLNIEVTGLAKKGISSDGYVQIDGGRTTILTSGGGDYDEDDRDATAAAGVKCDSIFRINNGELYIKSTGAGGKGISADQDIEINGGIIHVITTGKKYTYSNSSTSPKGIKSDKKLTVNGGEVMVRTTGGEGAEGIESKGTLDINAGSVAVYSYDDCINSKQAMTISGGYVYTYATNNDGIDSNGALTIKGGLVIAIGATQPEDGFDCDQNSFTISGGTVIGIGGGTSAPSENTAKQPVAIVGVSSLSAGNYLTLDTNGGSNVFAFLVPRSYNQATILLSSPSMQKGGSYVLSTGATVQASGNDFYGYQSNATASGGSALANLSLSSMLTTSNYSGGMGGMGGGGRRW